MSLPYLAPGLIARPSREGDAFRGLVPCQPHHGAGKWTAYDSYLYPLLLHTNDGHRRKRAIQCTMPEKICCAKKIMDLSGLGYSLVSPRRLRPAAMLPSHSDIGMLHDPALPRWFRLHDEISKAALPLLRSFIPSRTWAEHPKRRSELVMTDMEAAVRMQPY